MSITHRIDDIERSMNGDDAVSVVHGVEALMALLREVDGTDAVRVRVSLCRWFSALERHQDVAAQAQAIHDSPATAGLDRLWGRFWAARASARLNDESAPIADYLTLLNELGDDFSTEATDLGNWLWGAPSEHWSDADFLAAYLPWVKPRFADAANGDQWVIMRRIREHADTLASDDPATVIASLDEALS